MSFLTTIKSIPITDLAQRMGYTLVRKGRYYTLKEHDSVMINTDKNCFWRNSRFIRGVKGSAGSTIDFVMEFENVDYKQAMRKIAVMYGITGDKPPETHISKTPTYTEKRRVKDKVPASSGNTQLLLPEADKKNDDVFRYLLKRGISRSVIKYFLARHMLYQDMHKNCVFVSPRRDFAFVRGTSENYRFLGDCEGSNYNECFFFKGSASAKKLVVTESVIDLMSVMTYLKMMEKNYTDFMFLALAGTPKIESLFYHLWQEKQINEVFLCFDRDTAGMEADRIAKEGMETMGFRGIYHVAKNPDKTLKDWNDYIKSLL